MEAIFYIISFLAGAGVALLASGGVRRQPPAPPAAPVKEDAQLAKDIELISQWGNLLRYDGREQGESEE